MLQAKLSPDNGVMRRILLTLAVLFQVGPFALAEPPKKVLLVASGPDGHPVATHEYSAGLEVLAKCLKSVPGIEATVAKADGAWKEGPDLVGRADAVVLYLSEGAKWLSADEKRLAAFQQLAKRGGGLAVLHWGMGTKEAEPIEAFVSLFGGCHGGPDRKYKVLEKADVRITDAKNPIATGIKDFTVREEFYYKLKMPKGEHTV